MNEWKRLLNTIFCHQKSRQALHEIFLWRRGVVVIATEQLPSTKLELRFCAGSNPARGVSGIHDGKNLWQWSWVKIRLNAFCRSTIQRKQFIIIIIIMTIPYFKINASIFCCHLFSKKLSQPSGQDQQNGKQTYCWLPP